MRFCTKCGTKSNDESAKFCYKCGTPLVIEKIKEDNSDEENTIQASSEIDSEINNEQQRLEVDEESIVLSIDPEGKGSRAYKLGIMLEDEVENILKAKGYSTERRKRLHGKTGTSSEIDILATKTRKGFKNELIVECKNFSSPVPIKEIRDFWSKMQDLGKKNGLFAVFKDFSKEAAQFGQEKGLLLWSWDDINEKLNEIKIGRLGKLEQIKIRYNLPLKISDVQAMSLDLENKDNIIIENVKLIWKPFYLASYQVKCTRIDPAKNKHTINDSGSFTIDGLSNKVIKQSDSIKNAFNKMLGQSDDVSQMIKENDIFLRELEHPPETGLSLTKSDNFEMIVLPPKDSEDTIQKEIIHEILKKPYIEYYKFKRDEDNFFADPRPFKINPRPSEIKPNIKMVYIPIWEMDFQSKEYNYARKITGTSGTAIYDTIVYCNKPHISLGKKNNIAACDICGEVLCKEHIWKCTTCGSWCCESHSKTCICCQRKFCHEHLTLKCADCKNDVCDSCSTKCIICGELHCKKDMKKCSKCGRIVCVSCTRKEGGILSIAQKIYCKEC
jgi:hypothetical protein